MDHVLVVAIAFSVSMFAGAGVLMASSSRTKARDRLGGIMLGGAAMFVVRWAVDDRRLWSASGGWVLLGLLGGFGLAYAIACSEPAFRRLLFWRR